MREGTQASDRDLDPDRPIRIAIPKILCRLNGVLDSFESSSNIKAAKF